MVTSGISMRVSMYVHNLHAFQCISPDELQGEEQLCSHHNWMNITWIVLIWEKILLCRRPRWACVPVKSHFSPQNRPEVIHRPFVCFWHRDKAHKKLDDSYVSSALVSLSLTGSISLFPFVLFVFSLLLPPDLDKRSVCIPAHCCDRRVFDKHSPNFPVDVGSVLAAWTHTGLWLDTGCNSATDV